MSNTGLVTKFVRALVSGETRAVMESITPDAIYRGPVVGTAAGTASLVSVMNKLVNTAPSPWHVLRISEDDHGVVILRRELRIAGGISYTETVSAMIDIRAGKIATWVESIEGVSGSMLGFEPQCVANEADAAALIR